MKQEFEIYKLHFKSALHLSKGKSNTYESSESILHSDTMKSALFVCLLQLFGEHDANDFFDNMVLSSAYPFDENSYYLPKPLSFRPVETPETRKQLKSVKYLTIPQFESVVNGEQPTDLLDHEGKSFQPEIWENDTTQRVKVNYDEDSEPYYWEKLYPVNSKFRGLYFIVKGDFNRKKFKAALRLLSENGVGSRRSLGNGQFEFNADFLSLKLPEKATEWMNLSLYLPKDKNEIEAGLNNCTCDIIKRGGWISSPEQDNHASLRKESIMMFIEGSVFHFSESESVLVKGKKENVKPDINGLDHPVWRDGKAIFLPVNF
jgi:CRISPR type III-A-associated RAMP protein Csm4